MVTAPEISRQDAFLAVCRTVTTLIDAVENLAWPILDKAEEVQRCEDADPSVMAVTFKWDDEAQALAEAKAALSAPILQVSALMELLEGLWNSIREVERELSAPGEWRSPPFGLLEAVDEALAEAGDLDRWLDPMAVAVFGPWGMHWFRIALRAAPGSVFGDLEHCEALRADELVSTLLTSESSEREQEWERVREDAHRWIYEQVMAGVKYRRIIEELKTKPTKWPRYGSIPGIKGVARKYAKDNRLPLPKPRKHGRPPGS